MFDSTLIIAQMWVFAAT